MIALVPLLLLGGIVLVEQPIDGVEIRHSPPWSATTRAHTRCADLDGDGAKDIVTPVAAAFQRDGQFPKAQQTPLPRFDGGPFMDVWEDEIFVLMRDRMEVLRWSNSEWQRTLSQPIEWGDAVKATTFGRDAAAGQSGPVFKYFLCAIDGDAVPEIVLVAPDGIHVFAKKKLFYEAAAAWPVVPPLKAYVPRGALWPPAERRVAVPGLVQLAAVRIDKRGVCVQVDLAADVAGVSYRQDYYAFDPARGLALLPAPDRSVESAIVDAGYRPCQLNQDDAIDLVRVKTVGETAPPLSVPIAETSVSTDGGKTFFSARSLGAAPQRLVTDYNNDGRLDLVSENKRLIDGGIRETLVRGLTRREVDLEIAVRLQDSTGGFPAKPTFSHTFTIELDRPPVYRSAMFKSFIDGALFSLDGDFDGDGVRDAALQDRPDRIVIRQGTAAGTSSAILATVPASPNHAFAIADIDEDGRADIVISPRVSYDLAPDGGDAQRHFPEHDAGGGRQTGANTVYLSRGTAQ